jgi:hypothetical protein
LAVDVAVEPLEVLELFESASVVVALKVTTPVPVAVAVAVAVAFALVLHHTSPASEALIRHSARVPMLCPWARQ